MIILALEGRMLIVGERINSSRQPISQAIEKRDKEFISKEAIKQSEAGADYIDVNAGTFIEGETECLLWLVKVVQEASGKPLCIDTVDPEAAAAALKLHQGKAILNSISGEKERYNNMLPLVKEYGCSIVASCLDSSGIPETAEGRIKTAAYLIDSLTRAGVAIEDIFIDPLVQPISVDHNSGVKVLKVMEYVKKSYPEVRTICGISNISFGLPLRRKLNQTFIVLAEQGGLGAAIIDPLDKQLMANIISADALLGKDEYCTGFIKAYRSGRLDLTDM